MSHTPGPWEYTIDDDGDSCSAQIVIRMGTHRGGRNGWEPQHRIDYEVGAPEESPEQFAEAEANARLIAAAPELLAALKQFVNEVEMHGHHVVDVALAAIAKAEGR